MLLDRRVEGMIFISCVMTNLLGDHSHYNRLVQEGARLVFVNGVRPASWRRHTCSSSARPSRSLTQR
jgi:hypothetical protein